MKKIKRILIFLVTIITIFNIIPTNNVKAAALTTEQILDAICSYKAQDAINAIDSIGDVSDTGEYKARIALAEIIYYGNLTATDRRTVTNYEVLENAKIQQLNASTTINNNNSIVASTVQSYDQISDAINSMTLMEAKELINAYYYRINFDFSEGVEYNDKTLAAIAFTEFVYNLKNTNVVVTSERIAYNELESLTKGQITTYVMNKTDWNETAIYSYNSSYHNDYPGKLLTDCDNNSGWLKDEFTVNKDCSIIFTNNTNSGNESQIYERLGAGTYWITINADKSLSISTTKPDGWIDEDAPTALEIENAINEIGNISYTESTLSKINNAEELVDNYLSKGGNTTDISNYSVLTSARLTYDQINAEKTQELISAIDSIGAVEYTEECFNNIIKAEALYNSYIGNEADIINIYELSNAKMIFEYLHNSKIKMINESINAIGTVTYDNATLNRIVAAEALVNEFLGVNSEITNLEVLLNARENYNKLAQNNSNNTSDNNNQMVDVNAGLKYIPIYVVIFTVLLTSILLLRCKKTKIQNNI